MPRFTNLQQQIQEARENRDKIVAERDKELETKQRNFENQRDSYVRRIEDARKAGDMESVRRWEADLAALPNPRRSVEDNLRASLTKAESQLKSLETELKELRDSISRSGQAATSEFEKTRQALLGRLQGIDKEWGVTLAAAREQLTKAQEQVLSGRSNERPQGGPNRSCSGKSLKQLKERIQGSLLLRRRRQYYRRVAWGDVN